MDDFRLYLQKELLRRCRKNPAYSVRAFARDARISPSALSSMLRGGRPITNKSRTRVGVALGLKLDEIEKFKAHVHGNAKAGTALPQHRYRRIAADTFALISEWQHYAILELMKTKHFSADARWIATRLGLSVHEINMAIERLLRLGLVKKTACGLEDQTEGFSSDLRPGLTTAAQQRFLQAALAKAIESIRLVPVEKRDNTSMILAVNAADLPAAREKIKKFRRTLTRSLERNSELDEVYQLSISLVPLTKPRMRK